jgi:hypothetical protein
MDLTKIPYYKPNPIYNYRENEMVPIVPVPEKQEDCYTYEEHRAFKTMWDLMRNKLPLQIKNPHLIRTNNTSECRGRV